MCGKLQTARVTLLVKLTVWQKRGKNTGDTLFMSEVVKTTKFEDELASVLNEHFQQTNSNR